MFSDICFYVKGKTIEVDGQDFLLGELTESCLNITPDEFHELRDKHKILKDMIAPEKLNENLDENELDLWRDKLFEIDSLLRKHKIFQVIGASVETIHSLLSSDDLLEKTTAFLPLVIKYGDIISDIYSFNQTIFVFIVNWIMNLGKCEPWNYAAAYYDFIYSPSAYKYIINPIQHSGGTYKYNDTLSSFTLMPRETFKDSGEYIIAEYYHTSSLQSLLKIDYMKGLMTGHCIRRCEHCKRFYLSTNAYRTRFCDKPSIENPKFTCKQIAYRKTHVKDSNDNNPKYQTYKKAVHRITRSCQRGSITEDVRDKLLNKAEALYHTTATSPKYSDQEFEKKMSSGNLYKLCGIEPPKRGRPKAVKDENG